MRKISIFGSGWLGKALAEELEKTYFVQVSVRSRLSFDTLELPNKYLLNADNDYFSKDFYETDVLIVAIPPRGAYIETLRKVIAYLDERTQVILCSSTSVYTQTEGDISEKESEYITTPSLMLEAERVVQKLWPQTLILRLGGLMGYERIAGKYSAGKVLPHDTYVNYIHRDDVVNIIRLCIEEKIEARCYNVVAPDHSSKKEIYEVNAKKFGFKATTFESDEIRGKKVSSARLVKELRYDFLQADPLLFWS